MAVPFGSLRRYQNALAENPHGHKPRTQPLPLGRADVRGRIGIGQGSCRTGGPLPQSAWPLYELLPARTCEARKWIGEPLFQVRQTLPLRPQGHEAGQSAMLETCAWLVLPRLGFL